MTAAASLAFAAAYTYQQDIFTNQAHCETLLSEEEEALEWAEDFDIVKSPADIERLMTE
jgi:hypothetical protein